MEGGRSSSQHVKPGGAQGNPQKMLDGSPGLRTPQDSQAQEELEAVDGEHCSAQPAATALWSSMFLRECMNGQMDEWVNALDPYITEQRYMEEVLSSITQ